MKGKRAADVVYNYRKHHATREQLIVALRACSNPVEGCTQCIYKQMGDRACIMHMMEDAAHVLEEMADEQKA